MAAIDFPIRYDSKIYEIDKLSKQIEQFRPINNDLLTQIKAYFRIGLTYSSNAIEGNTLTETETKVVLEDGLTIAGKPLKDHYEAAGHSDAFDLVFDLSKKKTIAETDILNIHKLFYYRIDKDNAGRYRKIPVIITGTEYLPPAPSEVPALMKMFVANIPVSKSKHHPVEAAALIHKELVDIHPFADGNGRTARLLMNLSLFQSGYPITIIPPILRSDYITLIKQSQTGKHDVLGFVNFITHMVYESAKDYLRLLKQLNKK